MPHPTTIQLDSCRFTPAETLLIEHGKLKASLFRYPSGVDAVRLTNSRGQLVMLPYQGQQIWSMHMDGRNLGMQSIFDQPHPTQNFGATYGAFFLHCGLSGMGHPGPGDTHPLHGELPNAPFQKAWIACGRDDHGDYLELAGDYRHSRAFACDYTASSAVRLYDNAATVPITLTITNHRASPLEYLYLAHINFNPVDHARLVYSAPGRGVQLMPDFEHSPQSPQYVAFIEKVRANPSLLDTLDPSHQLNPEVVLYYFDYKADRDGWAHSLHIEPTGHGGYVKHRPDELDKVIRWIVRTPNENAIGVALPATATPEGYTREKARGNIRTLVGGATTAIHLEAGLLTPEQTAAMEVHIAEVLKAS